MTPIGQLVQLTADLTGRSTGLCVGGSVAEVRSYLGVKLPAYLAGQVCYVAGADGTSGLAVTAGEGTSTPGDGVSVAPVYSNAKSFYGQGGFFVTAGGSVSNGYMDGVDGAVGKYNGKKVYDIEVPVGVGTPGPAVHAGATYTWLFPG